MGFASEWFESTQKLIENPSGFYQNEERRDGFGYPLKFAAFSLLISGLLGAVRVGIYGTPADVSIAAPIAAGIGLVSSVIGGLIGLIIGAGFIHIFVALLGGDHGYSETLSVGAYTTSLSAVASAFGLIPLLGGFIGLVLGIYGIYVQARGLENFQNLSFGRSLAALLLPGIILAGIGFLLMITVLAGFMAAPAAPAL